MSSRRKSKVSLFDKCNLIDFPERGDTLADLFKSRLTQGPHAFGARGLADFRRRPFVQNQFANPVGKRQQLSDGRPRLFPVVERVPHELPATSHNRGYLATKASRSGHLLELIG